VSVDPVELRDEGDAVTETETLYECTKCRAQDVDRGGVEGFNPPPALNCWKCKAGLKLDLSEMFKLKIGMFPKRKG
jgi:hypothetical protein